MGHPRTVIPQKHVKFLKIQVCGSNSNLQITISITFGLREGWWERGEHWEKERIKKVKKCENMVKGRKKEEMEKGSKMGQKWSETGVKRVEK